MTHSEAIRYHSSDDMDGLGEFDGVTAPVAVVIRADGSIDAYGYLAVVDQRTPAAPAESEVPAGLGAALAAAMGAAERFAVAWDVDISSPDGDKHASEQWLRAALDMSNAIPPLIAAMPAGWQG